MAMLYGGLTSSATLVLQDREEALVEGRLKAWRGEWEGVKSKL